MPTDHKEKKLREIPVEFMATFKEDWFIFDESLFHDLFTTQKFVRKNNLEDYS